MITLRPPQWAVFNCASRFRILVAGRRFGKTYLSSPGGAVSLGLGRRQTGLVCSSDV